MLSSSIGSGTESSGRKKTTVAKVKEKSSLVSDKSRTGTTVDAPSVLRTSTAAEILDRTRTVSDPVLPSNSGQAAETSVQGQIQDLFNVMEHLSNMVIPIANHFNGSADAASPVLSQEEMDLTVLGSDDEDQIDDMTDDLPQIDFVDASVTASPVYTGFANLITALYTQLPVAHPLTR